MTGGRPGELTFLLQHGLSAADLARAQALAAAWDVSAADALLAAGLMGADAFYPALAAELGLPFLPPGFDVHALARFPETLQSGIAPLADSERASHVLAPRGQAVSGLLARRGTLVRGLALTSPDALREAMFRCRGEHVARQAAENLVRSSPESSFHDGLSGAQTVTLLALLLLVAVAGLLAGRPAWIAALVLCGTPFLGLAAIKIASILERSPTAVPLGLPRSPDAVLPVYTVMVPLHRERLVLPQLRRALADLDYPAAKLDAKLLVEEGDGDTIAAIAELSWPAFVETVTVPAGMPRTKPRALNVGLMLARGRFIVVFDAEDVPHPGQLRDAVALFDRFGPEVACLQARLVIDNTDDALLTRFFTVEYGALFDVVNPALAHFDLPVPLGGTSNHLKVDVLRALGGWDPWNVTEDADLGVRLALAGYRVADLPSTTLEEAPARLGAWFAQRTRWMKGFVQVVITHSRQPVRNLRRLGTARFVGAALLVAGAVTSAAIYPVFAAVVVWQLAQGTFFDHETPVELAGAALSITLAVSGLFAMTLPAFVAIARRGWWRLWPIALLMPVYYALVGLGAWRGLFELVLDPDRWNKTEHGLARTSRTAGETS